MQVWFSLFTPSVVVAEISAVSDGLLLLGQNRLGWAS